MFLGPDHIAIRTELPIRRCLPDDVSRSSTRLAERGAYSSGIITVASRLALPGRACGALSTAVTVPLAGPDGLATIREAAARLHASDTWVRFPLPRQRRVLGAVKQSVDLRNVQPAIAPQSVCVLPRRLEGAGEHSPHADAKRQQEQAGDDLGELLHRLLPAILDPLLHHAEFVYFSVA